MKYRITFDVSHPFASETGWVRSVPLQHFRPDERSFDNTYREPTTGVIMLQPAFFKRASSANFVTFSEMRSQNEFWSTITRGGLPYFSNIITAENLNLGAPGFVLIEILVIQGIVAILSSAVDGDDLKWTLQSNFSLAPDESFAIHYTGIHDSMKRRNNWLALQWDNIYIHIATTGHVRVYKYADRSDMSQTPTLVQEFDIAHPGDLVGRQDGVFWFLPIPGIGLVMQHSLTPQKGVVAASNTQTTSSKSVLIPWQWHPAGDSGYYRMFEGTPLTIATNPYLKYVFGIERVRFATSGSYVDAPFDPGYTPSNAPAVSPQIIPTGYGSATGEARKADNSGAFVAGTDRKGRVKTTLTGDGVHSAFLTNYAVSFPRVANTRNPGSFAPTKLMDLEFSYDEYERFEGRATVLMEGADRMRIAHRGDATFLLEKSSDGSSWSTVDGGIATDWENEYISLPAAYGHHIKSSCVLHGMHYRLEESHVISEMAFDGNTVAQAINAVLAERGFASVDFSGLPHEGVTLTGLTAQENTWKYAPKIGEGGWTTIQKLLFNVRRQNREYYLKYNWGSQVWQSVQKARNTDAAETWYLVNDSATHAPASRRQRYSSLRGKPYPPEANEIVITGLIPGVKADLSSSGQNSTARHLAVARNPESLTDTSLTSYLGRIKRVFWALEEAAITGDVSIAARRVLDAVGYNRETWHVGCQDYQSGLTPNRYVEVWDDSGSAFATAWIKRVTVKVTMNDKETSELELDSIWAGDLP